jgi:hypothetical protein
MAENGSVSPEMLQSIKDQVFSNGNGGNPVNPYAPPATPAAPVVDPPPAANPANVAPPVTEPVVAPVIPPVDYNAYLRENFGFDSVEVAKTEIEKLRNQLPVIKELEFPDETAKKLYLNLKENKYDEVANYINGINLLKGVETKTPEEQLKLFIKMQNPRFDSKDVDEEYADTYSIDEENIAPEKLGRERKKMDQRKEDDLAKARAHFSQFRSKIDLPDITPAAPAVDPEYQQYQQLTQQIQESDRILAERISKVSETDMAYKQSFADDKSKIAFDISYEPTKEIADKAKAATINIEQFLKDNYYNADGSPQTTKWMKDLAILQDIPQYTVEVTKQAINATIKWFLANQKNVTEGGQRNYAAIVPTEVDKIKEQVFGK